MAISPRTILFDSTNGPLINLTNGFQVAKIITGTINVNMVARRLRHCVVKSARKSVFNTVDVFGIEEVSIYWD